MNFKKLLNLSVFLTITLMIIAFYPIPRTQAVEVVFGQGQNSISGQVFSDNNGNGQMDAGESGLSGFRVYLDLNKNESFEPGEPSILTDPTGQFVFSGLTAGTYNVREVQQKDWIETDPVYTARFTYTITIGALNSSGLLFGNHLINQGNGSLGSGSGSGIGGGVGSSNTGGSTSNASSSPSGGITPGGSPAGGGASSASSSPSGGGNTANGSSTSNGGSAQGGSGTSNTSSPLSSPNGGSSSNQSPVLGGGSSQGGGGLPTGSVLGETSPTSSSGSTRGNSSAPPMIAGSQTALPRTGVSRLALELLFGAIVAVILLSMYRSFRIQK